MKTLCAVLSLLLLLLVAGCGGDGNRPPPQFEAQIVSDGTVDAYIEEEPVPPFARTVFLGTPTLFAGVDPDTEAEDRAFIDFPLDDVPANAVIDSATLSFRVRGVALVGSGVPLQIDLVEFVPPVRASDYSSLPALRSVAVSPIRAGDVGGRVAIDVTSLMRVAQSRGSDDLQLRILEDLDAAVPGLVEIDDDAAQSAPRLDVVYH